MNQKIRVLIVDSDVVMAKYLASHLSRRNFEVTVASTQQEALRIFRAFDPVLVLMEASMDGASPACASNSSPGMCLAAVAFTIISSLAA